MELATALGNDSNYSTTIQNQLNNKADKLDTDPKAGVNVALSILHSEIDNRVLISSVGIINKFK